MRFSHLAFGLVALAFVAARPVCAEDAVNTPVYIVTYFEVAPPVGQAAAAIRSYAEASRKQDGNTAFDAFEEIGRPSRFATFEAWRDKKAAEAHGASPLATGFRDKLAPQLVGPFEVRVFNGFSLAPPRAQGGREAVYVVTHVDVFPAGKDQAAGLVTALAEAGRKDAGNLWFDVLQQDGHANHFTLVEAWRDHSAFEAGIMAAHTRDFRQKLTPLEGALYDERLYRKLP